MNELQNIIEEAAQRRVDFLLARESEVRRKEDGLKEWFRLRNILEVEFGEDFPTGDIVIRVKRVDAMRSANPEYYIRALDSHASEDAK